MVEFPDKTIYLYNREIDFRKGIASLSNLIHTAFPDADHHNSLFIFFSKNARQVKCATQKGDYYDLSTVRLRSKLIQIIIV